MEPSDAALVAACRRGDATAWETLLLRYQRLIYSIPRRAGLNEDQAAEVFQHTFTTMFEHLERFEHPERIGSWLATVARREAWRLSRRERVITPLATGYNEDDEQPELPDNGPLPDEVLLQLEQQHLIRQSVEALDERCRTLLVLLFYQSEPPSYVEIASTLGISIGSIGPTRARCLQKLRQALDYIDF
ncbi:MAG: sigma-70 family RNA polymerase sigma factor [Chloroflexaceae bacterium]|nr:sigma-70 family RNA polymerase sigma factor [Chloroflexaceae bacterium]NJO06217.1 sigma-70 family RNA polymerase sigma factor [Chloroflexaceae bacterium]